MGHYLAEYSSPLQALPHFGNRPLQSFSSITTMRLLSLALTVVSMVAYMAVPSAADIIAFSGSECDGDEGLNVPCDGSCHQFTGRESFEVRIFLFSR